MRSLLLALATLGITSPFVFATAQIGDFLDYEGKQIEIYSTPLEDYLATKKERPDFPLSSTACWRGYIGLWRIKDEKLLLISLHDENWDKDPPLGKEFLLSKVFSDAKSPIEAKWYSGVLRIPEGEQLRSIHMGFGTVFERDRYITIKKGVVVGDRVVNNKEFGATRSTADLQWVALAEELVEDKGDWIDARTLVEKPVSKSILSGKQIKTRGIFFSPSDGEPASLWIPSSPTTEHVHLRLARIPEKPEIATGSHVEIVATYSKDTNSFDALNIRQLEPGESMHHSKFKPTEKDGTRQPATLPDSKPEGDKRTKPESDGRSQ